MTDSTRSEYTGNVAEAGELTVSVADGRYSTRSELRGRAAAAGEIIALVAAGTPVGSFADGGIDDSSEGC